MFIFSGTKKHKLKRTAYSQDYCNACEKLVIAEKWTWKSWFHLFWLSLIPLGSRFQWICSECKRDTNGRYQSGLFSKLVINIVLLALVVLMFQPEAVELSEHILVLRISAVCLSLGCLLWLFRHKKSQSKVEIRQSIPLLQHSKCHYCQGELRVGTEIHCGACQLQVYRKI
ncbi:hypothetical protein DBZ36_15330 [Alginatibacterium sediminis]|uniref:Zinc-ribbon domain-containing protein n=1 Tax=Alginatibacterium sediminis TaxID=2164068 RepID=A0A420E8T2_9ALTE|nr:hypothetical protein [Alginatibacterium sediminis]RKF15748.1 hypothetical protein DBZ36_15330 [Alginatibacterium sediminis]